MSNEEKDLVARGAECVLGDLVLHRAVVGQYRMGQFLLTPEGRRELDTVVEGAKPAKGTKPAKGPARGEKPAIADADDMAKLLEGLGED